MRPSKNVSFRCERCNRNWSKPLTTFEMKSKGPGSACKGAFKPSRFMISKSCQPPMRISRLLARDIRPERWTFYVSSKRNARQLLCGKSIRWQLPTFIVGGPNWNGRSAGRCQCHQRQTRLTLLPEHLSLPKVGLYFSLDLGIWMQRPEWRVDWRNKAVRFHRQNAAITGVKQLFSRVS